MDRAARPFGFAGAAILVFMMGFTTWGVLARQLFNVPILGVVDVMELALVACIFFAMPGVFFKDMNVTVDVVDALVSRRVRVTLRFLGLFLTLAFLCLMMTEMADPAIRKLEDGEVTMTLGMSRFLHWIPIIIGFALSIVATGCIIASYLLRGVPLDPVLDQSDD